MYTPSKRGQLDPDRRRATPDRYCRSPRRFQYDRRTDSNHFYQDRHSSSRGKPFVTALPEADHGSRRSSRYRRRDDLELVLEDSNSDSEIDEGGIRPRKDDIIDSRCIFTLPLVLNWWLRPYRQNPLYCRQRHVRHRSHLQRP